MQLILVLDDSIANIALPTIQNELGISSANLLWIISAYTRGGEHVRTDNVTLVKAAALSRTAAIWL